MGSRAEKLGSQARLMKLPSLVILKKGPKSLFVYLENEISDITKKQITQFCQLLAGKQLLKYQWEWYFFKYFIVLWGCHGMFNEYLHFK